jgi:hypothetical protein
MTRRTVLIGLTALVLAGSTGVALASPPPLTVTCARGEITSSAVRQVVVLPYAPARIHLNLEGWIGPCAGGGPLPSGYRYLPYYQDGTVIHLANDPRPFASTTQPTQFNVDISIPERPGADADPLVAVCVMHDVWRLLSCVGPNGTYANGLPVFVAVPTSVVLQHPSWPPRVTMLEGPDPTCGTCV